MNLGSDGLYLYLPASVYTALYDEPVIYKYAFDVEESQRENMTAFLDRYLETEDTSINYLSAASARASAEANQNMIRFVGGIVGLIFGIAGVLNLINMLITSILIRRHEFATMQSIKIGSTELAKLNSGQATVFRRKQIGFVFQNYNLVPVLTVWENI